MQKAGLLGHGELLQHRKTSNLRASNHRTISNIGIPQKCGRGSDSHLVIFMAVSLHFSTKESNVKINKRNISKLYKRCCSQNSLPHRESTLRCLQRAWVPSEKGKHPHRTPLGVLRVQFGFFAGDGRNSCLYFIIFVTIYAML